MHHRMGSYYDSAGVLVPIIAAVPPGQISPKKGILIQAPSGTPPPPPPTSSIPSKKPQLQYIDRPSLVAKGLGDRPPEADRSERTRKNLQRLKFECNDMKQITALNKRLASLTIADMSPRLALQRILTLYERGDHREAAAFIRRLTYATFRQLVDDLPMGAFIDSAMPHSLPILEAIYAKLFLNSGEAGSKQLNIPDKYSPEAVVWQIVKYFASQDDEVGVTPSQQPRWEMCGPWVSTCKRLLAVLLTAEPRMRRVVADRRKVLTKAIEGLGQHGLVGTSDESLLSLHDALRVQFERVQKTYTEAVSKLEGLIGGGHKSLKHAPIAQSHQRQLSLKASEIQERLIKNKTLLNVVEPTLENPSLEVLLGILQRRIELDKEVLFQFTQLKKEAKLMGGKTDPSVAPLLMRFQRGCQQVLDLMKEVAEEVSTSDHPSADLDQQQQQQHESGSDYSGYHSDSDSTVMMSGNSPFVSKMARYNFLSRSVRSGSKHHLRTSLSVSSEAAKNAANSNSAAKPKQSPSSSGFSSIGNSSCSSGSPPDSDTNSHNDEQRSSNSPIVITRAVINIKSSGDMISEAAKPKVPEPSKPTAARNRKLNKKTTLVHGCAKCEDGNGAPRIRPSTTKCHIYQGLVEDILSDEEEDKGREEVTRLKGCLDRANNSIAFLKERERKLKDRLQEMLVRNAELCSAEKVSSSSTIVIYDVNKGDKRPANLLRTFGELYSVARLETLDELDTIEELVDADELKNKLLFSVVVLSFRSAMATLDKIREQMRKILQLPSSRGSSPENVHAKEMEAALHSYMRRACDSFDLTKNVEEVTSQIWATLYDYPCLKGCQGLKHYIGKCVRVSWGLVNQVPQYVIEYETRSFKPDLHVRFHSSNPCETTIRTYLWPALKEGKTGPCVHKAVVLT